jgi:hypothetical protein
MNQVLRVRLTRLINGRNITLHSTLFLLFSSNCFLTHLLPFRFYCFFSSLGLHLFLMSDIFSVLPASKKNPQVVFPEHSNLFSSPFLVRYLLPIFFSQFPRCVFLLCWLSPCQFSLYSIKKPLIVW